MNIVVLTHSGKTITRPSTTLEKNGHDLYLPDFVTRVSVSPALFVNISRPGKCIGRKFALRYADNISFGCLIYPENLIDGSAEGYACASCLDHTTRQGSGHFPIASAPLRLCADGETVYEGTEFETSVISDAIAEVSRFVFVRTGDLLAIELAARRDINLAGDITAEMNREKVLDFKII